MVVFGGRPFGEKLGIDEIMRVRPPMMRLVFPLHSPTLCKDTVRGSHLLAQGESPSRWVMTFVLKVWENKFPFVCHRFHGTEIWHLRKAHMNHIGWANLRKAHMNQMGWSDIRTFLPFTEAFRQHGVQASLVNTVKWLAWALPLSQVRKQAGEAGWLSHSLSEWAKLRPDFIHEGFPKKCWRNSNVRAGSEGQGNGKTS